MSEQSNGYDQDRVTETAAFKADQIRVALSLGCLEADTDLIRTLRAQGPHHGTITYGENVLATIRALSIVSLELQETLTLPDCDVGDDDEEA
ncbi:hypothetical protein [Sinorhizobium fredii]|uniref:hypothetical protein n=1 Tax=Rhizobium fredii TaxID=380 RepID=UPI0035176515